MSMNTWATNFIETAPNDEVFDILAHLVGDRRTALNEVWSNHGASDALYIEAYNKLSVKLAERFVDQSLSDAQFDHVLNVERRPTVLRKLATSERNSLARARQLLNHPAANHAVAASLMEDGVYAGLFTAADWSQLEPLALGRHRVRAWLEHPEGFSDEHIAEAMRTYESWSVRAFPSDEINWLVATRPNLVRPLLDLPLEHVQAALAGSRSLTDVADQRRVLGYNAKGEYSPLLDKGKQMWNLVRFIHNPVSDVELVKDAIDRLKAIDFGSGEDAQRRLERHPAAVTTPFESVEDPDEISWLIQRVQPRQGTFSTKMRSWDIMPLLSNRNLTDGQFKSLVTLVTRQYGRFTARAIDQVAQLAESHDADWARSLHLISDPASAAPDIDRFRERDRAAYAAAESEFLETYSQRDRAYSTQWMPGDQGARGFLAALHRGLGNNPGLWETAFTILAQPGGASLDAAISAARAISA